MSVALKWIDRGPACAVCGAAPARGDLADRVRAYLVAHPAEPWDAAVWAIVRAQSV